MKQKSLNVIISGGGTGGHVFPAIAIANAIKKLFPSAKILFVGAQGKMEMEKVPKAGFPIKGLWISGFHRKLTLRNLMFPIKLLSSLLKSWIIIQRFQPDIAVGVGGFASGPLLQMANLNQIPTLIQEQNSYAGVTNKILAKKAKKICVAYNNMHRYFPKEKIVLTGNPVRKDLKIEVDSLVGYQHFQLDPNKKTIFVFGGSLGARSINEAIIANFDNLKSIQDEVQILWQAGKLYMDEFEGSEAAQLKNVAIHQFIDRMDLAYKISDVIICRAGALTIAELSILGKAAVLVPSPNVAEDHQTKNAQAIVEAGGGIMIPDRLADEQMLTTALDLLNNDTQRNQIKKQIAQLARPNAAEDIARAIIRLVHPDFDAPNYSN